MKGGKADANKTSWHKDKPMRQDKRRIKRRKRMAVQSDNLSALDSETETNWKHGLGCGEEQPAKWQQWDWDTEQVPTVSHFICVVDHNTATGI